MALEAYRKKRQLDRTPEPAATVAKGRGQLRFVVQKHAATRLHYDFRLELEGVLKSWAVPKGPSLNPEDKRLAIAVEDHPLDYARFEGVIPKGNYGAGTVVVWDEGTYEYVKATDRDQSEAAIREGLERGRLHFALHGKKLRGEFSLVKLPKAKEKNAWLLIKTRDQFATTRDVTRNGRSVLSGRTLEEVVRLAPGEGATWSNQGAAKPIDISDAPTGPFPRAVKPMLATLIDEPFDREGWIFEIKWDGYRVLAEVKKGAAQLYSRNQLSLTSRFAPIAKALSALGHDAVLDGEVVVVDEHGKPSFQLLQNYQKTGKGRLVYYVFDLLHIDGHDVRPLALSRRKEILSAILDGLPNVLVSEHVEERGKDFFRAAAAQKLEGIMAKKLSSPYREGIRSRYWLKTKTKKRQEAVIAGFTEPRGSRRDLGALILGVYEGDELKYVGHTGGRLSAQDLTDLRTRLDRLVIPKSPFKKTPKANAPVHWVRPELVCEVTFQEWTDSGSMRFPIFLGLREDKLPRSVRREKAIPAARIKQRRAPGRETSRKKAARASGGRQREASASEAKDPPLTNLNKIYWPEDGFTKKDLIDYHRDIAPVLLPHLRERPESLHRHPNGIAGPSFFQKDMSKQPPPSWVETIAIKSESEGRSLQYLICQDERTLLYLANLGCIEINPWLSRIGSLDRPDYLVLDLDPEGLPFDAVVEVAIAARKILERAGTECFCKTSGKRGLHIYVPLRATYDYDQSREFAEMVASLFRSSCPE